MQTSIEISTEDQLATKLYFSGVKELKEHLDEDEDNLVDGEIVRIEMKDGSIVYYPSVENFMERNTEFKDFVHWSKYSYEIDTRQGKFFFDQDEEAIELTDEEYELLQELQES